MKSVAVIRAGITGLTAAYRLHRENIPVTVYEAAPRVGGPIQTIRRHGYLAECGPNTIMETSPVIRDLVKDLGLETLWVSPSPRQSAICLGRKIRGAFDRGCTRFRYMVQCLEKPCWLDCICQMINQHMKSGWAPSRPPSGGTTPETV
jgi:phytoene dehydrogenase-like protein